MYEIKNKSLFYALLIGVLAALLITITAFIYLSDGCVFLAVLSLIIFIITFKRIKLGIYLSAFLIPLIPRLPERIGTANFSIAELVVLVVLFNWILSILINKQSSFKKTRIDLLILLFAGLTFVSFLVSLRYIEFPLQFATSANNLYPLKVLLNTLECILFFYLVINVLGKKDIKKAITVSLVSLSIVSLFAIFDFFYLDNGSNYGYHFVKSSITDGALELTMYPKRTFNWGYSLRAKEKFPISSQNNFSIEGLIKVGALSDDAIPRIRVSCFDSTGQSFQWIATYKKIFSENWSKVKRELNLDNSTSYIRIGANILTINNTIEGNVFFDNITLKQNNQTIFFESFDSLEKWEVQPVSLRKLKRVASTFSQPNILGAYIILFLPFVLLLLFKYKSPIYFLVSIVSSIALAFSFSRGAVAGFIIAMALFFKQNKKTLKLLLFFIVILLIILTWQLSTISPVIWEAVSFKDRVEISKGSLNLIKENPLFGIGLGTFRISNNLEIGAETDIHHAHNIYLQIAVERGLITLFAFLALLFVFYKESLTTQVNEKYLCLVKGALLIGITAVLIHGLVDYPFYSQRIALLFWMVLGIVIVINQGDVETGDLEHQ